MRESVGEGDLEGEGVAGREILEGLAQEPWAVALPGMDGAVDQALRLVGHDPGRIHRPAHAQAVADSGQAP